MYCFDTSDVEYSCVNSVSIYVQKSGLGPNHHPTESRSNFYCFINPTIIASASLESSGTPWFTFASITTSGFANSIVSFYDSMINIHCYFNA